MPIGRRSKSPRKSLHNLLPGGHGSLENVPPLPSHKHLSPPPANGAEPTRIQLSPLSNNELNGTRHTSAPAVAPPGGFTAVNSGSFTALNNGPVLKHESSRDGSRPPSRELQHASPALRDSRAYTSPYDTTSSAAVSKHGAESASAPPPSVSAPHAQGPPAAILSNDINGAGRRDSPANSAHHAAITSQPQQQSYPHPSPAQAHAQAEPQAYAQFVQQAQARPQQVVHPRASSRTSSPSHPHARSLAPHPPSRTNTPHAPVAPNKPPPASNASIAPAPTVQTAHIYNMSLVPNQPAPAPGNHPPQQQQQQVAPQPGTTHHQPRHPPVLKSQTVEVPQSVPRAAAVSMVELRALQCEVTAMLLHWLFPKPTHPPDEPGLLHRINTLWYHGEPIFRPELGAHYDLTSHILTAWLQERYAIANLQHALATHPGLPTSSSAIIDRLLAMNDLRAMRLKWKNMSPMDGMSPEDILIKAFCVMTMTEHTEFVFKEGLSRVERSVFEFLRTEDAKIVLHRQ
jgi:hypothetical protein